MFRRWNRRGRKDCRDEMSLRSPRAPRFLLLCIALYPSLASAQPTFTKDIAPIIRTRCTPCHRPGEIGPFNLITYDDVRRHATQIADATARRIMPPWKPVAGTGDFQDARRLTDRELDALQRWIASGAAEGDASALPPAPNRTDGWQLGTPDLVVRMADEYAVPADGTDVFRTFVMPIPISAAGYVRAIEFRPGNARVVHHANLGIDRTRSSRQLDARDKEPGYTGSMERDARYPEGQLLGWTPGQAAHPVPDGTQWRLEPGSDLVVQLHLQPTGKTERVRVEVGFFLTSVPPTRSPVGLRLGSETIDIPPGAADYVVTDRYELPVDVQVLAVQPHAHNLARRMEAKAQLPDGSIRWLIGIDDWDFRWQDVYRYAAPFELPKGSTISIRYTYDNSAGNPKNPHHPPARVVWGQNTADEMGDFWIQVIPRNPADEPVLTADFRRKANAEDLAAYTRMLEADPENPLRHDAVASLYLDGGMMDQAVAEFRQSLRLNPDSAPTYYNLGFALSAQGRRDEAMDAFRNALRIDPDYAQAHNNLGALLQLAGEMEAAQAHYQRAVALRPDNVESHTNLAPLLMNRGRVADAATQFSEALSLRADNVQALAGLAWIRATASDAALRNPAEALRLAARADESTRHQNVIALDALAAAYAAAGDYDAAIQTAQTGAIVAAERGQPAVAAQFRQRLELYRQRLPLRLP